ncbi:MAG: ATP-dependent Clp protease ATP-binding subunit, partial [Deltaproteobacteria bacterium]|nr:ATP-dependent Clp protease ATP-binding subunit [Deltaproteobacteria bacterium]
MKNFIIELIDKRASRKELISFSDRDIMEIRRGAGKYPVSPLIVSQIQERAGEKRFLTDSPMPVLLSIAREMLIDGQGVASLTGHYDDAAPAERYAGEPKVSDEKGHPFCFVAYDNPLEDMVRLGDTIRSQGRIPIVWSRTRGFMIDQLSVNYPLFDNINAAQLSDPKEAVRFIISRPQKRVSYIFEDFHHYLGVEETINPMAGELRALMKELYSHIDQRGEKVYLFVPRSYKLPSELEPLFTNYPTKSNAKTSGYLSRFGQCLTDPAYLERTKPVIGATVIIDRVIQILSQMETNNPLLVGHPGVGKTAIVDGLARAIYARQVPPGLKDKIVYSLSLTNLIAETRYRGDLEARMEGLMAEVIRNKDKVIIFIDEIHTLINAGAAEGGIGVGDILKPVLSRGEFPCIGATTITGSNQFFKDPALARRFKKVIVKEPSPGEALNILRGICVCLEKHHGLRIDDAALVSAVDLCLTKISDEYLPSKAISLVDGAAAYCRMRGRERG